MNHSRAADTWKCYPNVIISRELEIPLLTVFVVIPLVVSVNVSVGTIICDKNSIQPNTGKVFGLCQRNTQVIALAPILK